MALILHITTLTWSYPQLFKPVTFSSSLFVVFDEMVKQLEKVRMEERKEEVMVLQGDKETIV